MSITLHLWENWPDDFDLNPVNGQMNSWGAQNLILDLPDRTIDPAQEC